jgi:hypothetical protein
METLLTADMRGVPGGLKSVGGELLRPALDFLEAQDIRLAVLQPIKHRG